MASVFIYTWMMPKSLSNYLWTTPLDCFADLIKCSLLLFPSCFSSSVLSHGETWSFHCSIVVENVTLEPAFWGVNADSATYCVSLGKEMEAQNGQIFGDLSRPLFGWLGTYSEAPAVAVVSSTLSPQPSTSGSAGAELLEWLLSLTTGPALSPSLPTSHPEAETLLMRFLAIARSFHQVSS